MGAQAASKRLVRTTARMGQGLFAHHFRRHLNRRRRGPPQTEGRTAMHVISFVASTALMLAPVAASAMTPLQQETAIWQAFKDKNAKAFSAMLAPNSVSLYEDGAHSRTKELDSL